MSIEEFLSQYDERTRDVLNKDYVKAGEVMTDEEYALHNTVFYDALTQANKLIAEAMALTNYAVSLNDNKLQRTQHAS